MGRRAIALLLGVPLYAVLLAVTGWLLAGSLLAEDASAWRSEVLGAMATPGWWRVAPLLALVLVATQAVFLIPVATHRLPRARRGKPLALSALILAVVAAGLTVGFLAALAELFLPLWGETVPGAPGSPATTAGDLLNEPWFVRGFWIVLGLSWAGWSLLLVPFVRRGVSPEDRLGRAVGWLWAGTFVETLVVLPIDVMVRRRTDCYCATGSFIALLFALVAALWLTGPGVILALTSKRRRLWQGEHCPECGYRRGPSPGPRCPECGHAWTARHAGPPS